jgi:sugar O-acyltransferase (sialic acid O-acetyltransferase NeuD family)
MQEKMKVIVIGAGGHGKVVADAILKQGEYELAGFADDNKKAGERVFLDYAVLCKPEISELKKYASAFVLGIGNNQIRKKIFLGLKEIFEPVIIIHPSAQIALDVTIGKGTVVLAGAIINSSTKTGENCIINSKAFIDHDCVIGDSVHIGQAVNVGSGNEIKEFTHLKSGESVISAF